jgi:hypothetical protein
MWNPKYRGALRAQKSMCGFTVLRAFGLNIFTIGTFYIVEYVIVLREKEL